MLLTITYEGQNTQNLGYLLHKHPSRPQEFPLPAGKAYVFYPEVSDEKTTIALLLDLDSFSISRGKPGSRYGKLSDYVNDRPYAASSFLSTAIARVFGSAMNGHCEKMQELADGPLKLSACVYMLPVRDKKEILKGIFEPLGYQLSYEYFLIDEKFPEWGESPYVNLTVSGRVRLADLLCHLYVLIPVFDRQKHYFVTESEVDKLLLHGAGWLEEHPMRNYIVQRYFPKTRSYADAAMQRLSERDDDKVPEGNHNGVLKRENERTPEGDGDGTERKEIFHRLDQMRLHAVVQEIIRCGASSVIDLGCGEGKLLELLLPVRDIRRLCGMDVSAGVLERAGKRLFREEHPWKERKRLELIHGSLLYKDSRLPGYGAACVTEVIEHIPLEKLKLFEKVLFREVSSDTIILTTPNREYNARYQSVGEGKLRHEDHRFEWTRNEFSVWTARICEQYGYEVQIKGIGEEDETYGFPTQMGVFTKCR